MTLQQQIKKEILRSVDLSTSMLTAVVLMETKNLLGSLIQLYKIQRAIYLCYELNKNLYNDDDQSILHALIEKVDDKAKSFKTIILSSEEEFKISNMPGMNVSLPVVIHSIRDGMTTEITLESKIEKAILRWDAELGDVAWLHPEGELGHVNMIQSSTLH